MKSIFIYVSNKMNRRKYELVVFPSLGFFIP